MMPTITRDEISFWLSVGNYTPAEAAWLLLDQTPQSSRISDTQGLALAMARAIQKQFETYEEDDKASIRPQSGDPLLHGAQIVMSWWRRKRITLDELRQFAQERGLNPMILHPEDAAAEKPEDLQPQAPAPQDPVVAPHGPVVALATPEKPRAKPGPKPDPALQQAIEMALKLGREGLKPKQAAWRAAEQFQVESDTVERRARERRNSQ